MMILSKSIIPKETKDLMRPIDQIIFFHPDRANKIEYYQQEINKLHREIEDKNKTIDNYKRILNELSDKKDELKYLREFRDKFSITCFIEHRVSKITLLSLRCICPSVTRQILLRRSYIVTSTRSFKLGLVFSCVCRTSLM